MWNVKSSHLCDPPGCHTGHQGSCSSKMGAACPKCGGPTTFSHPYTMSCSTCCPLITLPPNRNLQRMILSSAPQSQKVPIISPPYDFQLPYKKIQSMDEICRFHDSYSGTNFIGFVVSLSESIRGHENVKSCYESQTIGKILSVLDTLNTWIEAFPPDNKSSRYGNISFKLWHERLIDASESLMQQILLGNEELKSATVEIVPYFTDSFGNQSRIDYGTGHETNFIAWLYCLARLGIITEDDYQAVVARVFVKYLKLMRCLQLIYRLEPAGSHGVWGLDDFHFLPFIFGSSQLIGHKFLKPKSIHNQDILVNLSHKYMYFSCISFIKKVKKGHFQEHSSLLNDISGVSTWENVNTALLNMYKEEVLEKVPIMQHFLFGYLIKWIEKISPLKLDLSRTIHPTKGTTTNHAQ